MRDTSSTGRRVLNLAWNEPDVNTGADTHNESSVEQVDATDDSLYGNTGTTAMASATADVTAADVGRRVSVRGYASRGTLRFFGKHHERGTMRCGVELDSPEGKNDGTVNVRGGCCGFGGKGAGDGARAAKKKQGRTAVRSSSLLFPPQGHFYFECKANHGILTLPSKVILC